MPSLSHAPVLLAVSRPRLVDRTNASVVEDGVRADEIAIPTPCEEDWDGMAPAGSGRYCERCSHKVHDLSSMTEAQARALVASKGSQRVCVAVRVRGDELVHADSPIPARSLVRRPVLHRLAPSVLAGALILFGASACVPNPEPVALDVERLEAEPSGASALPYVVVPDSDPLDEACIGGASCENEATDEGPKHAEKTRKRRKRTRRKHPPKPTAEEQMLGFLL